MNNKWTRVNKVAVIISFCVSVLGCVLLLVFFLDAGQNLATALTSSIAGLISALISHIIWAMYIEMSENIVRISSKNSGAEERALNDISQTLGRILANMSGGGAVRMDEPWECQSCGKVNPPDARFCQKCGNPRNGDSVKVENLGNTGITRGF